jgi:hypothetical protein
MKTALIFFLSVLISQSLTPLNESSQFVLVELRIESKGTMHPYDSDFWVIDLDQWNSSESEAIFPLYLKNYSQGDLEEAIRTDTVVFFDSYQEDKTELTVENQSIQDDLVSLMEKEHRKAMTIKKNGTQSIKRASPST